MFKNRTPFYIGILFAFYLAIFISFIGTAEVSSDEGVWGLLALDILEGARPLLGDGWFIKLPALFSYIEAFFLYWHRSHEAVLIGLFLLNLIGHYFIIKTGELIESFRFGVMSSLLYFFKPIFFNFYSQKAWQVSLLPLFICLFTHAFFQFERSRQQRWSLELWLWASLAFTAHMSAVFLLAPLLYTTYKHTRDVIFSRLLLCLFLYHGLNVLVLKQFKQWPLFIGAHVLFLLTFWLTKNFPFELKNFKSFLILRISALLVLALLITGDYLFNPFFGTAIGSFLDFLPAANLYIAQSNLLQERLPWLHSWLSVELLLLVAFIFYYANKKNTLWDLVIIFLIVLVSFEIIAPYGRFPHQWFIFLLPVILFPVLWLIRKSVFLCLIIIIINAHYSLSFARLIQKNGGQGQHMATLSSKNKMIDFIKSRGSSALVFMLNVDWYGARSWTYLYRLKTKHHINVAIGEETKTYYVYEHAYRGRFTKIGAPYTSMKQFKVEEHILFY